jgi:IS5 family transposase
MRKRFDEQPSFMQPFVSHEHGRELAAMDEILDQIPGVLALVQRDLAQGRSVHRGRRGMAAEQVLRAEIVKQLNGFSYYELSFHLEDSTSYRTFCRLGKLDKTPSRSSLQENIKRVSPATMQKLQEALVAHGGAVGMEDGSRIRVDCTVTESNIHEPTDSSLLWDTTRRLSLLLKKTRIYGVQFSNRTRKAKHRWVAIQTASRMEHRVPAYRDLIAVTRETCQAALGAATLLERKHGKNKRAAKIARQLRHFEALGQRVIDQTERRVLRGESVPAREKVVSIFEPETDIIVKSRRGTEYGHKICLVTGASGLVIDCVVERGNPADVTLTTGMIDRHIKRFGSAPEQAALDGGFASKDNLSALKERGVKDVAFSKRCGMQILEMVRSTSIYRALRYFRAGIEGMISFLKRVVGLERCTWKGLASFQAYVLSSVATANLLLLARHQIAA